MNLRTRLDRIHRRYHRPQYLRPDPLQFVHDYSDPADREVVALIAAGLAFGRVATILANVERVLVALGPRPAEVLRAGNLAATHRRLRDFRHRWCDAAQMRALLEGMGEVLRTEGSLRECFRAGARRRDEDVRRGLAHLVDCLAPEGNCLLPRPDGGSACKRLHMFMRWMVRRDEIDPGGWSGVSPARLLIPLDTHMFRIGQRLGLTRRKQPDLAAVLEITEGFRRLRPRDPVRYDFSLTRLGIRADCRVEDWL